MSVLNLGLQHVGLLRSEGSAEFERAVKNCNSIADLLKKSDSVRDKALASVSLVVILLTDVFKRLKLRESHFFLPTSYKSGHIIPVEATEGP